MKKNIAIVGYGSIGKRYHNILNIFFPNYNVFIIRSRNFLSSKKNKSIIKFKDNKNLIFELAIICSPASLHLDQAIFFAKKKTNLLIEKPLSSSISKKITLLQKVIRKNKLNCNIGYMFKYSQEARKVKELIKNNTIGKIKNAKIVCDSYLPRWRKQNYKKSVSAQKKLGGGVINELSHEIHLMLWFFGFPKEIYSFNYNSGILDIDCEDNSISTFVCSNKVNVNMKLSFSEKLRKRFIVIYGRKGEIKWDIDNNKIYITKLKKKVISYIKENLYQKQLSYILENKKSKKEAVSLTDGINVLKIIKKMKNN